jgi:putative ATPase
MNSIPLSERLRPNKLEDYIGQQHLVGKDGIIKKSIQSGVLPSIILWGPPGVGKTTLANIISKSLNRPFYPLSAINSGVKDVREVIDKAKEEDLFTKGKPIVFIDEIHRFSKSQQDSLLSAVEKGTITLIGATTENPSFEVIPALLSRCQVYVLNELTRSELEDVLKNAILKDELLKLIKVDFQEIESLLRFSGGDARKLLNAFELVVSSVNENEIIITNDLVNSIIQKNLAAYDKSGEQHYNIISAFIKSVRGSDPNAAVYWLARMLEGGEDLLFIARRLIILASEDIGNANPTALIMANNCFQAVNTIGYPESRIILSQCTVYLASSPKSNASYLAINNAIEKVKSTGSLSVPLHLRNAPTKLMKELNYGKEYQYSHNYENNFSNQEFLPEELSGTTFYLPGNNARENEMRNYLKNLWKEKYGY